LGFAEFFGSVSALIGALLFLCTTCYNLTIMSGELEPQLTSAPERRPFHKENAPGLSWLFIVFLLALLALAVIVLGKPREQLAGTNPTATPVTPAPTSQPRIYTISYDAGVFSPTNLRVHAGDTVRIKNESIFPIHVRSEDIVGLDSIGDIPQGSYFSFTFAAKGTFGYFNVRNLDQAGTVIVR